MMSRAKPSWCAILIRSSVGDHNKVVYRIARGLRKSGAVVLRFNYRGVNLSEGEYGHGVGEMEDARASLAWLRERYPDLPYSLAGVGFGSRIVLQMACGDPAAQRVIAVGFPTTYKNRDYLENCLVGRSSSKVLTMSMGRWTISSGCSKLCPSQSSSCGCQAEDHFFKGASDDFERVIISLGLS